MGKMTILLASAVSLLALAPGVLAPGAFTPALAQTLPQAPAALSGQVSSAQDGLMEGAVVSARKDGSTITVSVVSDDKGHFSFPASRLDPGHYAIGIRAVGYDLDGPKDATLAAGQEAKLDVTLKPTRNLGAQLTNAEWLMSMPGTDDQKRLVLDCNSCHTLERIVRSTHDAAEFQQVFLRMAGYYPGSTPLKPQRLVGDAVRRLIPADQAPAASEWLASINLSGQDTWSYPLKTLPRLTGKSTHVIMTEYDLPNKLIEPHDVVLDHEGNVWYSDFGQMFIGKMDPKTGKVTQYPVPESKKDFPVGSLNLEIDKADNIWLGAMYQAEILMFDPKTETFKSWSVPKEW
ncbi:MAG TPA: carboxypeptidase regulatory-like domain-containing protein, partial [Xanthobacteraceae bacterium]